MDYGKRAPDLGWRMTDAWLSMAGASSKGLPNGRPIDEWGIRMEEGSCNPAGASVSRGGETNGPAAVYAIAQVGRVAAQVRASRRGRLDFYQSLPALAQGNVAQQIFWYTAFTADMVAAEERGQQHRRRQGQAALAHGAVAARPLLEGGHEARLSGRRLLDAVQVDPARPPQGRLALRPVRRSPRRST